MKALFKGFLPRLIISLAAICIIVFSMHDKLGASMSILTSEVNWNWFLVSIISYLIAQAVIAYRLRVILHVQGIDITYGETLYVCLVGLFYNLFLPSAVGGDLAKLYYVYKYSGLKIEAATSVVIDRLMGFSAIILTALIALLFLGGEFTDVNIHHIVYLFIGIMIFAILFFGHKGFARNFRFLSKLIPSVRLRKRIEELYHAISEYRNRKKILLLSLILSFAGQGIVIIIHYWLALSLGVQLHVGIFFVLVPIVLIVSMAPSLGGLGVREAGFIYFFSHYMDSERALALSLLVFVLIYGTGMIFGLMYALRGGLKEKVIDEMEHLQEERS